MGRRERTRRKGSKLKRRLQDDLRGLGIGPIRERAEPLRWSVRGRIAQAWNLAYRADLTFTCHLFGGGRTFEVVVPAHKFEARVRRALQANRDAKGIASQIFCDMVWDDLPIAPKAIDLDKAPNTSIPQARNPTWQAWETAFYFRRLPKGLQDAFALLVKMHLAGQATFHLDRASVLKLMIKEWRHIANLDEEQVAERARELLHNEHWQSAGLLMHRYPDHPYLIDYIETHQQAVPDINKKIAASPLKGFCLYEPPTQAKIIDSLKAATYPRLEFPLFDEVRYWAPSVNTNSEPITREAINHVMQQILDGEL